jgi:uncharacterized protein YcfJ
MESKMALREIEAYQPPTKVKKGRESGGKFGQMAGTVVGGVVGGLAAGSVTGGMGAAQGASLGASLGATAGGIAGEAIQPGREAKAIERRMAAAPGLIQTSDTTRELQKSIQALQTADTATIQKYGPQLVSAYFKSAEKDMA